MVWGKDLLMDVRQAAEKRILYVFSKFQKVDVCFSGGKDSIALILMVIYTMKKHGIDFKRLSVTFVDEEAIFPDVPGVVEHYRRIVLSLGAKFNWLCLTWRHYNCTNTLRDEESWTCWDIRAKDKWVRTPPPYALRWHPDFKYGMSYQEFFTSMGKKYDGFCQMTGLRASESVQRTLFLFKQGYDGVGGLKKRRYLFHVLYDWKDTDVWKIIKDNNAVFPQTYINLWKIGAKLRMSQIFAADTCQSIPKMLVFYPNYYEKLQRRCPNIDIVLLYYETRMFKSNAQAKKHNVFNDEESLRAQIVKRIKDEVKKGNKTNGLREAKRAWGKIERYKGLPLQLYQMILEMIDGGDAKSRTYRGFLVNLHGAFMKMYGQGDGK